MNLKIFYKNYSGSTKQWAFTKKKKEYENIVSWISLNFVRGHCDVRSEIVVNYRIQIAISSC